MSIELNGDRFDVWRYVRVFSVSVLAAAIIGCHTDAESESPPPSRWWYFEDAPPSDGMPYRTAMLSALEGWNGEGSQATSLTVFNELYENGGLVIQVAMTGKASRPRCPMQGCYLYARRSGGDWQTLRAVPADDSRASLTARKIWRSRSPFSPQARASTPFRLRAIAGTCISPVAKLPLTVMARHVSGCP
jgi:hypothetical protein